MTYKESIVFVRVWYSETMTDKESVVLGDCSCSVYLDSIRIAGAWSEVPLEGWRTLQTAVVFQLGWVTIGSPTSVHSEDADVSLDVFFISEI